MMAVAREAARRPPSPSPIKGRRNLDVVESAGAGDAPGSEPGYVHRTVKLAIWTGG